LEFTPATANGGTTFTTPAMLITSGGNVGIGTSSPQSLLSLGSGVNAQKLLLYDANDNNKYGFGIQPNELRQFFPSDSFMTFGTISISNGSTFTERMRITSGGDIVTNGGTAYGTATNRGTLTIYGSTDSQISLRSSTTGAGYIYHTGTNMEIYNTNSGYIKFATENAEVYRITKEAWFLIQNTAAAPTTNPVGAGYLYVQGGALKFRGSSGTVTTIANA
jgi:hypothetical protein